jgi:DnaJ-class molecular chaperone
VADYYETLGVGVDASTDDIQRVYRQLAKDYHPDTNPDNPAGAEKLKKLSEAYENPKDPAKRQRYDRKLSLGTAGASRARSLPPEQKRAARHEAEQASRRQAEEERRRRDDARSAKQDRRA